MEITKPLSKREQDVVELLLAGKSNKMIASSLGISSRTVEFHLKNIYAKFNVRSRTEFILKLGNSLGIAEIEKLWISTVDGTGEYAENQGTLNPSGDRAISFRDSISAFGKEFKMKNVLSWHVLSGIIASLFTGYVWIAVFKRFGHMTMSSLVPWIAPLILMLLLIGLSVGLIGRRNENSLQKVFFSTAFSTGFSGFAMLPVVGLVLYPLAKFFIWLGLFDRSLISTETSSVLVIVTMILVWLIIGAGIGIFLLSISIGKSKHTNANA